MMLNKLVVGMRKRKLKVNRRLEPSLIPKRPEKSLLIRGKKNSVFKQSSGNGLPVLRVYVIVISIVPRGGLQRSNGDRFPLYIVLEWLIRTRVINVVYV